MGGEMAGTVVEADRKIAQHQATEQQLIALGVLSAFVRVLLARLRQGISWVL